MTNLNDPQVRELLEQPNYSVVSTINQDGSIHSVVVWVDTDDGTVAVNSAVGRRWPTNLERDPRVTVVVYPGDDPYNYVEIRGRATPDLKDADEHIDRLAKKYLGRDEYPFRQPGEQRIKFVIEPEQVRHQKQG